MQRYDSVRLFFYCGQSVPIGLLWFLGSQFEIWLAMFVPVRKILGITSLNSYGMRRP